MKDVLSLEEACTYLGLAKPTLYKFVRSGAVPAFKLGSIWRFHRESLDRWIQEKVKEDTATRTGNTIKRKEASKSSKTK